MGVRADLAAAIEAETLTTWPAVQIYAHPEDVTQVPAMVLVPDEPWAVPATFGGAGSGVIRWSFMLSMVHSRADVEAAIEMFEDLRPLIQKGIGQLGGRFKSLGKPDQIELAGIQVLSATMEIDVLTERQT